MLPDPLTVTHDRRTVAAAARRHRRPLLSAAAPVLATPAPTEPTPRFLSLSSCLSPTGPSPPVTTGAGFRSGKAAPTLPFFNLRPGTYL